jgi:hypothetical protein
MTAIMESRVRNLTTDRVHMGTWLAASLHRRGAANSVIRMTETCMTSSAVEMHADGSKTGAKSESALSRNDTMRGTMIYMVPSITNLTDNAPLKEGVMQEESKPFPTT